MNVKNKLKNLTRLLDSTSVISFWGSTYTASPMDKVLPLVFTIYQTVKTVGYNRTKENVGNNYLTAAYTLLGTIQLTYVLAPAIIEKRIDSDKILNTVGFFTGALSEYLYKLKGEI